MLTARSFPVVRCYTAHAPATAARPTTRVHLPPPGPFSSPTPSRLACHTRHPSSQPFSFHCAAGHAPMTTTQIVMQPYGNGPVPSGKAQHVHATIRQTTCTSCTCHHMTTAPTCTCNHTATVTRPPATPKPMPPSNSLTRPKTPSRCCRTAERCSRPHASMPVAWHHVATLTRYTPPTCGMHPRACRHA